MQENYHSGDLIFRYLTLGDKQMIKRVYSWCLDHWPVSLQWQLIVKLIGIITVFTWW